MDVERWGGRRIVSLLGAFLRFEIWGHAGPGDGQILLKLGYMVETYLLNVSYTSEHVI